MLIWRRGLSLPWIHVYTSICETYLVYWYAIDLSLIGGENMCPMYMSILLYVKLIWCSGIPYIYGEFERGLGICAIC